MIQHLDIIKGIHPGLILARELKRRKMKKKHFAAEVNEYNQTIVAITKAQRSMNTALALKAEKLLGMEEGTLMVLQAYHDIAMEKNKLQKNTPDLNKIRRVVFWDTNFATINWEKYKRSVIKRVFEKGNEAEKEEITRFYGISTIKAIMNENGQVVL